MGELTFILGLQVKQKEDEIFISQDKYVTEILKKFGFSDIKTASTPMDHKPLLKDADGQPKLGLWYPKDSPFDLVAYTDSDYARASLDRKSTTGGCQFLGCRLISWQCKKQTVVANSTTEAEYVAASFDAARHKLTDARDRKFNAVGILNYLQALVDRKKVIITETSVRRDLQLKDVEGIECLPNADIFEQLALMRYEKPSQNLHSTRFLFPLWEIFDPQIMHRPSA
ncbi:hypothetical protein Tco_0277196 [Tanacetum coccineum]